jgi:hypothetical protein
MDFKETGHECMDRILLVSDTVAGEVLHTW